MRQEGVGEGDRVAGRVEFGQVVQRADGRGRGSAASQCQREGNEGKFEFHENLLLAVEGYGRAIGSYCV